MQRLISFSVHSLQLIFFSFKQGGQGTPGPIGPAGLPGTRVCAQFVIVQLNNRNLSILQGQPGRAGQFGLNGRPGSKGDVGANGYVGRVGPRGVRVSNIYLTRFSCFKLLFREEKEKLAKMVLMGLL